MNKVRRIIATRSFERSIKKLQKKHKTAELAEIYNVIKDLADFKIATQKSNHPLKDADGHNDIHISGGDLILVYRYDTSDEDVVLIIDLRLQDVVNHDELKHYDKYDTPAYDYDVETIKSSTEFFDWYDALDESIQCSVDKFADANGIPLYSSADLSQLSWLKCNYVKSSEEFEDYEDEIKEIPQEYTSERTSINVSKVPAIFKLVSNWKPGTINLDFGGGRADTAADYLTQYDVINLVYDPYNRSKEHNDEVIQTIRSAGGADTATCSNVLNVIKEPEVRLNVLRNMKKLVKPSGKIYITVYEGSGKGDEGPTKSGYQLNRKTVDYLEEIQQVFPDATRKGKLIQATNDKSNVSIKSAASVGFTSEGLQDEIYTKAIEVMMSPNFGFSKEEAEAYTYVDVYDSDEHDATVVELRAEVSYDGMMELALACDPIVAKYDEDAYFDMDSPGIAVAYIRNNYIQSTTYDYGGAYDIESDMFFTKEEITDWADSVVEQFNATNSTEFHVADVYFVDTTNLILEISDADISLDTHINIDMRRITRPDDINKYTAIALEQLQADYDNFYTEDMMSCTSIMGSYSDDEPYYEPSFIDTIEFNLDNVVFIVDESGEVTYEDTTYAWASEDDINTAGSNDYNIQLDNIDSIIDKVLWLVEDAIPNEAGRYSVSGYVELVYSIAGLESETSGWDMETSYYTDDVDITYDFDQSNISQLDIKKL